jgi:hypothetical protein
VQAAGKVTGSRSLEWVLYQIEGKMGLATAPEILKHETVKRKQF